MRWGLCATVDAPPEEVEAFVAHHLHLGAAHVWIFLDDPGACTDLAPLPRATLTRCTDAYWGRTLGRRPEKHQNRQSHKMQRIYAGTDLPWVAHLDIDEFLHPARDVADVPPDAPMLRMAPWEALHDPGHFTARHFRAVLSGPDKAEARARVFGPHAPLLASGALGHAAGKCFFRTGLSRFEPRIHGAFRAGTRVPGGAFSPDITLLHFHANDAARWKARLAFRLTRGAYQYNPPLQAWLQTADDAAIDRFWRDTHESTPALLHKLRAENALLTADLHLHDRIARMRQAPPPP